MRGARCTRSPLCNVESTGVEATGPPEQPAFPHAMVLTAYVVLSPVTGLFCHRRVARSMSAMTPIATKFCRAAKRRESAAFARRTPLADIRNVTGRISSVQRIVRRAENSMSWPVNNLPHVIMSRPGTVHDQ